MAKNTGTDKKTDKKSIKKETDIDKGTDKPLQKKKSQPVSKPDSAKAAEAKDSGKKKPVTKPAPSKTKDDVERVADIQKDTGTPQSRSRGRRRRTGAAAPHPVSEETAVAVPEKTEPAKAISEASPVVVGNEIKTDIQKDTERQHARSGRHRRPRRHAKPTAEPAGSADAGRLEVIEPDIVIDTDPEKDTASLDESIEKKSIKKETDIKSITAKPKGKPKIRPPKQELPAPVPSASEAEEEVDEPVAAKKAVPQKGGRRFYDPAEFAVVQMMNSLAGFAPLGLLFVLMDVLNGAEEGLIRVNRLAASLGIGKPAMLAQLENLEKAGLMRTVSSSQRGRHVELLVPNLVICKKLEEARAAQEGALVLDVVPRGAPKNFSLDKLRVLHAWLSEHGIRVVSLPDESDLDPKLAEIAGFLGKYLAYVQPFYSRLKTTLGDGEEIQFSLLGFQGRDITHTLNFCKMLQDAGMLSTFTYRRAPHYKIVARLNRTPAAINFLSGGWLEHYIRDRVVAILTAHPATHDTPFAFMKNPRLVLPGDEDFEFDFLLMVGEKVFWIEAKTGDYLDYLAKYSRVSKLLGLGRDNNLLVLVDAPPPDAHISARYGLNCCSVEEFAEVFRISLVRELGKQTRHTR